VCDLETSRIGAPHIYIYIYDISSLRVKLMQSILQLVLSQFLLNFQNIHYKFIRISFLRLHTYYEYYTTIDL
jgi:hypothetical protein